MNIAKQIHTLQAHIKSALKEDRILALEESSEFFTTCLKSSVVVLQETISLHQYRASETAQEKQNRVTQVRTQMQALINSMDKFQTGQSLEVSRIKS